MVHVSGIGKGDVVKTRTVLVLGLEEDDWPTCAEPLVELGQIRYHLLTVRNLCSCNDWGDVFDVIF